MRNRTLLFKRNFY